MLNPANNAVNKISNTSAMVLNITQVIGGYRLFKKKLMIHLLFTSDMMCIEIKQ